MSLFMLFLWGVLAFWMVAPSDNPKSMRFQVQYLMEHDASWKFLFNFVLWSNLIFMIFFELLDIWSF